MSNLVRKFSRCFVSAGLVLACASSCTPGAATQGLAETPDIPDQVKCDEAALKDVISPLIMEWPTGTRADLEDALGQGVVVVNYSCEGVKVLPDCKVDGEYGYRGMTAKTDNNLIEGKDNINATFGGAGFGIDANMDRESKLDLSYVLVGKRSTLRNTLYESELSGDFCKGATHYVKRADVGAWSMVSGKGVTAGLAAKYMGQGVSAGSENKELKTKKDGDPKTCDGAKSGDTAAPEGCTALIRVSMAPIKKGQPDKGDSLSNTGVEDGIGCPKGYSSFGGICAKPAAAEAKGPFLCDKGDVPVCEAQCKAGSDASCNRLVSQLLYVEAAKKTDDDFYAKAMKILKPLEERLKAACKNDQATTCMAVGLMVADVAASAEGAEKQKMLYMGIVPYLRLGCAAGDPKACALFRMVFVKDATGSKERWGIDMRKYYGEALGTGCGGGNAAPCGYLAFEGAEGAIMGAQTPKKALALANKACLGDWSDGCLLAAALQMPAAECLTTLADLDRTTKKAFDEAKICTEENLANVGANPGAATKARAKACALGACNGQ